MGQDAKWYAVYTYSGYENKVKDNIEKSSENRGMQDIIQKVVILTEDVEEIKESTGERVVVTRKLYPCYVFVKMIVTDESWYVVRNTRGVTGFVGPEGKPVPLSDAEVERLSIERKTIKIDFAVGDSVRITDGPFEDYIGEVEEINMDEQSVRLTVLYAGKEMSAELDFSCIETL